MKSRKKYIYTFHVRSKGRVQEYLVEAATIFDAVSMAQKSHPTLNPDSVWRDELKNLPVYIK